MREINKIILHCSDTEYDKVVTAKDIDKWHKDRGFNSIGYHYVIDIDGTVESGRPLEKAGAHCYGHNLRSIGIVYVGGRRNGVHCNTLNSLQLGSLRKLILSLCGRFSLIPQISVCLHNEFTVKKVCPCFGRDYLESVILNNL